MSRFPSFGECKREEVVELMWKLNRGPTLRAVVQCGQWTRLQLEPDNPNLPPLQLLVSRDSTESDIVRLIDETRQRLIDETRQRVRVRAREEPVATPPEDLRLETWPPARPAVRLPPSQELERMFDRLAYVVRWHRGRSRHIGYVSAEITGSRDLALKLDAGVTTLSEVVRDLSRHISEWRITAAQGTGVNAVHSSAGPHPDPFQGQRLTPDRDELRSLTGLEPVEFTEGTVWADLPGQGARGLIVAVLNTPDGAVPLVLDHLAVESEPVEPSLSGGRRRAQQIRSILIRKAKELRR